MFIISTAVVLLPGYFSFSFLLQNLLTLPSKVSSVAAPSPTPNNKDMDYFSL